MFKIGDRVFLASTERCEKWVTCPDCFGKGALRVILGDDSQVSIVCECCSRGMDDMCRAQSIGRLKTWEYECAVQPIVIDGREIKEGPEGEKVTYYFNSGAHQRYIAYGENVFATEAEALDRSTAIAAERDAEEKKRLSFKEKPHKKWSWHVHYHRREIKDAQKKIAYHESKLAAIPNNFKEADKEEVAA